MRGLLVVMGAIACVGFGCGGSQHNNQTTSGSNSSPAVHEEGDGGVEHTEGERRCVTGDREACRQLAVEYQAQCDHGHLHRCVLLGLLYEHGRGIERDVTRAEQLFVRACEGNELRGCAQYAALYSEGLGSNDAQRGLSLGERACNGGVMVGCVALGRMYTHGRGVTRDLARAEQFYQQACDHNEPIGCTRLGNLFAREHDHPDPARGVQFLQRGCDAGDLTGCMDLGVLDVEGTHGVTRDVAHGQPLVQRACDGGEPAACRQLGQWYAGGQLGARDDARARELLQRACSQGLADACGEANHLGGH